MEENNNVTESGHNFTSTLQKEVRIKMVKQLRVDLDKQLQVAKILLETVTSREEYEALQNSVTRLKEAIMWNGMALKALGAKNPYPNSYNPDNTVVEPTADGLTL